MPKPRIALKVVDLPTSIAFYENAMDFKLADVRPSPNMAYMLDTDGDQVLLAGPGIEDVKSYLDDPRIVFKPGDTLEIHETDFAARHSSLSKKGLRDLRVEENASGDHKLYLHDPNGYTIVFISPVKRSVQETIALYEGGGNQLEQVLGGLAESDLDARRSPEEWTIRQIVHHLAESESLFLMTIKTALAASGSTYIRNAYDQDGWVQALEYTKRPIEPSLALIKASRMHVSQLLHLIPDNWERYVMLKFANDASEGHKLTVGDLIGGMVRHMMEHFEEIRQTRKVLER